MNELSMQVNVITECIILHVCWQEVPTVEWMKLQREMLLTGVMPTQMYVFSVCPFYLFMHFHFSQSFSDVAVVLKLKLELMVLVLQKLKQKLNLFLI